MLRETAVFLGEVPTRAGTLVSEGGRPSVVRFPYDASWVRRDFAVSPDLPLTDSPVVRRYPGSLPLAFADAAPDGWARKVLGRVASGYTGTDLNGAFACLLAADDFSRIGALRFVPKGQDLPANKEEQRKMPSVAGLAKISKAIRRFESGEATEAELNILG